jgi:hypothetical protein
LNITPQVSDPYTSENIYSLEKSKDVQNVMYATDNTDLNGTYAVKNKIK